jgi:glycosyltransferase involved in cell wall biosynthesis
MRIAALVPYRTNFCSGQRFRIELWARHLQPRGIEVEFFPFASSSLTNVLYSSGLYLHKAYHMLRCYTDQLRRTLMASRPDVVFIYREASLIGPALIEGLTRRWNVPVIYDIDEPLFIPYVSPRNGRLNVLKWISKTNSLFQMSDHVLAVNEAIGNYAGHYARRVSIVPMAVDTDRYYPAPANGCTSQPRVGWVGTLTNQPNLDLVAEPLRQLEKSRGAGLRVIADAPMDLPGVDIDFIQWSFDQEVPLLQECQVGIVPVKPSNWSSWKFFFKLIQLMSLGLPVVATPTGSNLEIIDDGVNGFFADNQQEWYDRLQLLIDNPDLRQSMGEAARETVKARFSLTSQIDLIENIFLSASHQA